MVTQLLPVLLTILGVHLLAVISPGPAFVIISRKALAGRRMTGVISALGMSLAIVFWAGTALLGMALLLDRLPWLYVALHLAGGSFLAWFAFGQWRYAAQGPDFSAPNPSTSAAIPATDTPSFAHAFVFGMMIELANPKAAVFFASIFVAFVPAEAPTWFYATLVTGMFCIEFIWFSFVSIALSTKWAQRLYIRTKIWIDRVMATLLFVLALKLFIDGTNTLV